MKLNGTFVDLETAYVVLNKLELQKLCCTRIELKLVTKWSKNSIWQSEACMKLNGMLSKCSILSKE